MADPDFELGRGPGSILLYQPASLPSVNFSFFTQNKGEARPSWAPPLDPPLNNGINRQNKASNVHETEISDEWGCRQKYWHYFAPNIFTLRVKSESAVFVPTTPSPREQSLCPCHPPCPRERCEFEEQIMSKEKYPSIFSHQMEAILFI